MQLSFLTDYLKLLTLIVGTYEKQVIIGDFNLTPDNKRMREFVDLYSLINLIKTSTCFKGTGSCIDLLVTNEKYSFRNTNAFETGLRDHHLLIYSMLKTSFQKNEPKRLIYRDYTSFSKDSFLANLSNSIKNPQCYEAFETKTAEVLDKHAPRKTKLLRGNHKPHVSKKLRKEIMKRSQLKSIANKIGKDIDLYNFRKQRNLVVNLNKKEKKKYLNSLLIENDSKPFWETCKPYFSNKEIKTSGNIILSDKEGLILKEIEVARECNIHFQSIPSSLELFKWPDSI